MEEIFISEAARLCKVDKRTFNKWVSNKTILPIRTIPPGFRLFSKADVLKLAKKLPRDRKKGFSILRGKKPRGKSTP